MSVTGRRRRQIATFGGSGGGAAAPWIISQPTFVDFTGWTTVGNPQISGGAMVAQFDGVTSSATKNLPATVDMSRPFQCGALFQYNGDARRAQVRLVDPLDTSFLGFSFSVDSGDVRAETGTSSMFLLLSGLVSGAKFWIGLSHDGAGLVTVFCVPEPTHGGMGDPTVFHGPVTNDYGKQIARSFSAGSAGHGDAFQHITQLVLNTQSLTNKILAVFVRQGNYTMRNSDSWEPPILTNPIIEGDTTTLIRVPDYKITDGSRDLVVIFHGANSSEALGSTISGADLGVAYAALQTLGYSTAYMRGTDDFSGTTYSGPKASNWGATGTLNTWWKTMIDAALAKFGYRNVYFIGQSMGLINALNMHALYPGIAKAIVGISGVCNLTYTYNSEGNKTGIDAAYGSSTVGAVAGFDPNLRPSLYTNVPIKLWHGDADATLDHVQHMDTFAASVNALTPGSVAKVTVAGGTHLGASMFDGAAIAAFFAAHV